MFLSSLSVYKWKDDYSVFALLIPSEKLFENFIFSTLKNTKGSLIKRVSRSRPGRKYLVKQNIGDKERFKMINDIVIHLSDNSYTLFDTKYKKIYNSNYSEEDEEVIDSKFNISQTDIYQMVSYAVGSGIPDIGLIYPALIYEKKDTDLPIYHIKDEFTDSTLINIFTSKVRIIHNDGLNLKVDGKLEEIFKETIDNLELELYSLVYKIFFKNYDKKR
jgi:5-methylcytosine-specific restriction endonuclease McrBC regulatory subunit McrC